MPGAGDTASDLWELAELWEHPRIRAHFAGRDRWLLRAPDLELLLDELAAVGDVTVTFRRRRGDDGTPARVAVCALRLTGVPGHERPLIVGRASATVAALRCLLAALEALDAFRDRGLDAFGELLSG